MSWLKSQSQFRRYEPWIKLALTTLDPAKPTLVTIEGVGRSTIPVQLRGAIRGWKENAWPTTWTPRWPVETLSVYETPAGIYLATKPITQDLNQRETTDNLPNRTQVASNLVLNKDELRAFCTLLSSKKLTGPFTFTFNDEMIDPELEVLYDVAITQLDQTTYRIL